MRAVALLFLLLLALPAPAAPWAWDLTPRQRRRSVSYVGGGDALRALVTKLNGGAAVTVAVLGGSISRGHGAGGSSGDRSLGHPGSWSRVAFDALKERWPAEHVYSNGAVPATGSGHFVTCLRYHLIPNADIVLMDFAVNDGKDALGSVEGIVRRVRHGAKGAGPVLLFVNWGHSWPGQPGKRESWTPEPPEAETMIESVSAYYDLPCISMRRALLADDLQSTPGSSYPDWAADDHHPSAKGHRMMGEAVMHLLESVALELAHGEKAPEPPFLASWLPPPMLAGNTPENENPTCHFGDDLKSLIGRNEGWTFYEDAEKPGIISTAGGSVLELNVGKTERILSLSYLASVRPGTGGARVSCVRDCECEPQEIDARAGSGSVMIQRKWFVTRSADCVLRVENTPLEQKGERGPGSSFKVMGIAAKITDGSTLGDIMGEDEFTPANHRGGAFAGRSRGA